MMDRAEVIHSNGHRGKSRRTETRPSPVTQADYIWLDGEFVPYDEAKVHFLSPSLHYGMAVFEKLIFLETELKILASNLTEESLGSLIKNYKNVGDTNVSMFDSLQFISNLTDPVPIFGELTDPPQPSADNLEAMQAGESVVQVQHRRNQPPRIFMLHSLYKDDEKSGVLMGEISLDPFRVRPSSRMSDQ